MCIFARMKKIFLIEDDPTLSRNIQEALSEEHIQVEAACDGLLAEKILQKETFDCVILDINLPSKNGFDLCKDFRRYNTHTPVIMLTAFDELEDKVKGFDCGADDYLTKPFYMRELLLRIQALCKRSSYVPAAYSENAILVAGDLSINTLKKKVTRQGVDISLTPREYQILLKLVENKGELVSKKELIQTVWGTVVEVNTNTIEVFISFLRNKVDKPFGKASIKTKSGFGYYFEET